MSNLQTTSPAETANDNDTAEPLMTAVYAIESFLDHEPKDSPKRRVLEGIQQTLSDLDGGPENIRAFFDGLYAEDQASAAAAEFDALMAAK